MNPPATFWRSLRYLGPGLILSAAIVGSGELIATTTLGAEAGFSLLWIILFGCLAKVAVQLEYGRYCICHGIPTFQAWNRIGRAKILALHWTVLLGVLFLLSNFIG
jgi:Mn2+/Fe2+ NRAMP family transporter